MAFEILSYLHLVYQCKEKITALHSSISFLFVWGGAIIVRRGGLGWLSRLYENSLDTTLQLGREIIGDPSEYQRWEGMMDI
jgi:hypothetical protein